MSNSNALKALNPLKPLKNNSNNINFNKKNAAFNIFMTYYSPESKKKLLIHATKEISDDLINNKNNIKNHVGIYPILSLLIIDNENYKDEYFSGRVKVWLIFNTTMQVLDYVIQIFPKIKLTNISNKIRAVKNLILKLINSISCPLIIQALIKFRIKVDSASIGVEECKKFRWSFSVQDIPILHDTNLSRSPPPFNN
jgi:hypothetical protein